MTKAELIERIARSRELPPDMTKKDVALILGVAFEELANYFAKARVTRSSSPRFTFPRFGTFTKKRRSARRGVNPRTLEPIQIDACHTLDFKASRELRETMNPSIAVAASRGRDGASPKRASAKASAKTAAKTGTKKKTAARGKAAKRDGRVTAASDNALGGGRRRMTPRDEEAELDALLGDTEIFEEDLPNAPAQRVRGRSTSRVRTG